MNYNYDYFISYAHKDNANGLVAQFVKRLKNSPKLKKLFRASPRVFFDKETVGGADDWKNEIPAVIDAARFMIVLLSPNYFQTERGAAWRG